jgi:hypothetical protein
MEQGVCRTIKGMRAIVVGVFLVAFTLATFPITQSISSTADDMGVEEVGWVFVVFGIVRLLLLLGGGVLIIGGYINIRDERERMVG